ncbi:efflux transporter outer membrane subunit [Coraliomargarita algicola]|uniref:Efflux transporter outer membrane subunit n=1 Tax=Coraliomargarita algicola TaxID=3092156 RepID=A0ABZ0RIK2_9BACT|nr:efflux transporter outer membrane subunit [Coraliomargarita sp. J2-16]WPJ95352.1 efflux transporter outer membrane subunit [Coraliomargarita sp. J2-16]
MTFGKKCQSLLTILSLFSCAGCAVHRVNESPEAPMQASHYQTVVQTGDGASASVWWQAFERPELDALIQQALAANPGLGQAMERVRQARFLAAQSAAGGKPKLSLDGAAGRDWEGRQPDDWTWSAGLGAAWELDLFRRIESQRLSDRYSAQARQADAELVALSLSIEVANAYFGSVAAANKLQLLQQQVELDQDLLELIQLRRDQGVGTVVDVLQQESQLADSQTLIPLAESELRSYENLLDILVGELPDGNNRIPAEDQLSFDAAMPPLGVPADLLVQRPDLRAALADLVAADASIAVAVAERLPQLTLSGSAAVGATSSYEGALSSLAANFTGPLLDWGRRKAEVERRKSIYQEQLLSFTEIYLRAVEEVETTLYQEQKQREFLKRLRHRRDILQRALEETEARFKQGIDDYLPVLTALQSLREIERDLIDEQFELLQLRIRLHLVTGGRMPTL